ncbi:MAG: hypothetical protein R3A13_07505 [Bdellovibrionota bacterium]
MEKLAVAAFNVLERVEWLAQDRAERAGMDPADYASVSAYLPESTQEYVEKVIGSKSLDLRVIFRLMKRPKFECGGDGKGIALLLAKRIRACFMQQMLL